MKKNPPSRMTRFLESLETRTFLSAGQPVALPPQAAPAAIVAAKKTNSAAATTTTLRIQSGKLGQAITFTVTVRGAASLGSPTGTVALLDHGQVIQTLTLSAGTSTDTRYAISTATYTIPAGGGNASFYYGTYHINAVYSGSDTNLRSSGSASFSVSVPSFKAAKKGTKYATVIAGTGTGITSGQTASVLYTGYLKHHGALFDTSANNHGTPLTYVVNANPETVVPGFDAATVGLKVGETRIFDIPSSQAYGTKGSGGIPANAELVFVVTLLSIT